MNYNFLGHLFYLTGYLNPFPSKPSVYSEYIGIRKYRVGLSLQKSEWECEWKEKGIALFALNVSLLGCDLLDNRIGRLHTNFYISPTLSKKVLIFPQIVSTSTLKVEVDNFFTESS